MMRAIWRSLPPLVRRDLLCIQMIFWVLMRWAKYRRSGRTTAGVRDIIRVLRRELREDWWLM